MPRTPGAPGGRVHRVSTALSAAEVKDFDVRRGPLSRSEFLRYLVTRSRSEDVSLAPKKKQAHG